MRRELSYTDLLKSIRQGKVKSINWFKADHKGTAVVDGPCLVEYIDGTLYQSNVPMEEVRCSFPLPFVYTAPEIQARMTSIALPPTVQTSGLTPQVPLM